MCCNTFENLLRNVKLIYEKFGFLVAGTLKLLVDDNNMISRWILLPTVYFFIGDNTAATMWAYCEVLGDVECGLKPYCSK